MPTITDPNALLRRLFDSGLEAVAPGTALPPHLPPRPATGRILVLGAGKASAHMAKALEDSWGGPLEGVVTVPAGYEADTKWIEVTIASHPTPDARSQAAAERALELAERLGEGDTLIGLISGGGSALWCAPKGITLEEKQAMTRRLLADGSPISEINRTRKEFSRIKGGGLARAAWPARTIAFAVSDVPGDNAAIIASGPCSPPEGDSKGDRATTTLIAAAGDAIEAAAQAARAEDVEPVVLGVHVEGDARAVAQAHAELALQRAQDAQRPVVLLSGGELTVTIRGKGRGGRNTEYLLALALALNGAPNVWALAADTDGVDGAAGAAGARIAPDTLARAAAAGLDARASLEGSDSAGLFAALGDLVDTGPTGTNVSDLRAILVLPRGASPA
jgi:hydroxypyruvate reductase